MTTPNGESAAVTEWPHCGICGGTLRATNGWVDAADPDKPGVVLLRDGKWTCPDCDEPRRFGVLRTVPSGSNGLPRQP